jgi:hypothetical protein
MSEFRRSSELANTSVTEAAERLAECAIASVRRRYPHKLDHLILHEEDRPAPHEIHPVFHGCYDWHSSVHMHWSLLRLCASAPALTRRADIAAHFDERFTHENVERERAYAADPRRASFERPYGWAWLLKLQAELDALARDGAIDGVSAWAGALRPFADDVATRLAAFLGRTRYPVRSGTHGNSAFAMLLALDYSIASAHAQLRGAVERAAEVWFLADRDYSAAYEPSGADFLSPGLCEALLMSRVMPDRFAPWWGSFRPNTDGWSRWRTPAVVADRVDPQLVHLDGLNLSRAWCLWGLADAVAAQAALDPDVSAELIAAGDRHWRAAWPHVTEGDFAATHWLVSFAVLSADRG